LGVAIKIAYCNCNSIQDRLNNINPELREDNGKGLIWSHISLTTLFFGSLEHSQYLEKYKTSEGYR
jgi:hypothetical protein